MKSFCPNRFERRRKKKKRGRRGGRERRRREEKKITKKREEPKKGPGWVSRRVRERVRFIGDGWREKIGGIREWGSRNINNNNNNKIKSK